MFDCFNGLDPCSDAKDSRDVVHLRSVSYAQETRQLLIFIYKLYDVGKQRKALTALCHCQTVRAPFGSWC